MVKVYDVCNKPNIKFDIDKKYVYVTTSITYIPEGFTQLVGNNKSYEFIEAVKFGKNVIISQKMLCNLPKESIKYLHDYNLIIDCIILPFTVLHVSRKDIDMLNDAKYISLSNNTIKWEKQPYNGSFNSLYKEALHRKVSAVGNVTAISQPHEYVFTSFMNVSIYTFMFKGQLLQYYFDLNNIKYELVKTEPINLKNIHLLDDYKLNNIGKNRTALSKTWMKRTNLEGLKLHTQNFIRNKIKKLSNGKYNNLDCTWTTYSDYFDELKGNGYTKLYKNLFTEKYTDSHGIVYDANMFINSVIKLYLDINDVDTNNDDFATSMLLRFIYTCNTDDLYLYLPSKRMRNLFNAYVSKNS